MAEDKNGTFIPAVVTFVVVAAGIYLVGRIVTSLLKTVLLPALALLVGYHAAKVVYRPRR